MELTGAAEAARKVRDEKSERLWRKVTRRGSVGVERWVRARWTEPVESSRRDWF